MESKKHICNKICKKTFEDFLKSAIACCILIEKYQGYFVRNIFRAASAFRLSFNKNESRFLLCLSDNLHNVPELAAARKEKVIKQDKVQKKRKTVKTGQTKTSGKKKTSVKSKSDTEFFLNLSPKEIKHKVVKMPVGIGMSSYLEKLWKEGKL